MAVFIMKIIKNKKMKKGINSKYFDLIDFYVRNLNTKVESNITTEKKNANKKGKYGDAKKREKTIRK